MENKRFSDTWLLLAREIVEAAISNRSLSWYERFSKMAPSVAGGSILDRRRVLEELLDLGWIQLESGILSRGELRLNDEARKLLAAGNSQAWVLAEQIDTPGKFLRKFEDQILKEIGLRGEEAVVKAYESQLPEEMHEKISHVSLRNDAAGFDIVCPSASNASSRVLLEVKSTVRPGDHFRFFISRREADIGSKNSDWRIVFVEIREDKERVLGYVAFEQIEGDLPIDPGARGSWASCEILMPKSLIRPGLP